MHLADIWRAAARRLRPPDEGNWETCGPDEDVGDAWSRTRSICDVLVAGNSGPDNTWVNGWWSGARRLEAHRGRIGGTIVPQTCVVHTTDMVPESFGALLKSWGASAGSGACANFIIGRTPTEGIVQMVPITRNANHAGGPTKNGRALHGWWRTPQGGLIHPNLVAAGIEVHNAGKLRWKPGCNQVAEMYSYPEKRVLAEFAGDEVHVDELGRPWHRVTDWQLAALDVLLTALKSAFKPNDLEPVADAALVKDRKFWDNSYGATESATLVGHVTLDPINKSDPGPQLMKHIANIAKRDGWR